MIVHEFGSNYSIDFHKVSSADSPLLERFSCENEAIKNFVQHDCLESKKDVTYVFVDKENNRLIGMCAICCNGISIVERISGVAFNTSIPAVEIDYFAIDEEYRSSPYDNDSNRYNTLSQALFLYMMDYIEKISVNCIGATHICLYAVPRAVSFYKRCGFDLFEFFMKRDNQPFLDDCVPMFFKMK